jgi:UDP-2,4-diacetamido-2,4,6-trideoxy-beta-L-altropyranose hydrolase
MAITAPSLLIRADASAQIGTGHVMRCLALAQAWQDVLGNATFAMAAGSSAAEARVRAEGMSIVRITSQPGSADDAAETTRTAGELGAEWVVVDGCYFDGAYQRAIGAAGPRSLVLDDFGHASAYCADFVLNPNVNVHESLYSRRESHTRLLLGLPYVLLRREFLRQRRCRRRTAPVGRRLLATMGGSDPGNATLKAIQSLAMTDLPKLEVVVVVGGDNPRLKQLRAASRKTRCSIRLELNTRGMPELMTWADMALTTAGGTLWELLFAGCPTMSFTRVAVQDADYETLERRGVMRCLGNELAAKPAAVADEIQELAHSAAVRRRMSVLGRKFVDGQGAARVVQAMRRKAGGSRARREGLVQGAEQ